MSPGGIPFESVPFFAMADAARSAIDDAVSKPVHGPLVSSPWTFTYPPLTESKQHANWVHLSWGKWCEGGVASGVPSKGGPQSETQGREFSSLSCCCTEHHPRVRPQARPAVRPELTVVLYASCSDRSPLSKATSQYCTTDLSPGAAFEGLYEG
jgi:hypothetical protein